MQAPDSGPDFAQTLLSDSNREEPLPSRHAVEWLTDELLVLLFPQLASDERKRSVEPIASRLTIIRTDLSGLLATSVSGDRAEIVAQDFMDGLPNIYGRLKLDAIAITNGDPAAESVDEVIAAYPGFLAIAVHRMAHELYRARVPIVPRLMSELAHTRTGIDIHPGATIGDSFCIDHGTGIVIGETATIGNNVKIYQGVTLGALSVVKSAAGSRRHPTIEDRVVLYAHATILGGDTVIGHDTIIGGNVWLTTSIPPDSFVYHTSQVRVRPASVLLDITDYSI
jgi:serine O-acetyltransferase